MLYFGLGDKTHGFEWLEKAVDARSLQLIWFKVEPEYDALRSDPRFVDMLRRLGLPQTV
jgi:hypothetical protein